MFVCIGEIQTGPALEKIVICIGGIQTGPALEKLVVCLERSKVVQLWKNTRLYWRHLMVVR